MDMPLPYLLSLLCLAAAVLGQVTSTGLSLSLFDDSDQVKYHTVSLEICSSSPRLRLMFMK